MIKRALRRAITDVRRNWNYDARSMRDLIDASPRAAWLASRVTNLLAAAALLGAVGLASPAAAQVSVEPASVDAYSFTPERIAASLAGL